MCLPDDLREVWTSRLNGIYFPNYTNQVLAIIKTGVTKTHRVQKECPPRLSISSYSNYLLCAAQCEAGPPWSRQSSKFTDAWLGGPWIPRRSTKEPRQSWNLKLCLKLWVEEHMPVFLPLG